MKQSSRRDPIELLTAAANRVLPPPDDGRFERRIGEAVLAGRARRRRRDSRRKVLSIAAAAVFSVAAASLLMLRPPSEPPNASIAFTETDLPTGDRIEQLVSSTVHIDSVENHARSVRLESGNALFDVAPLGESGGFEVTTPHVRITVEGTVFAVGVGENRSRVQVYEGHVLVEHEGRATQLHEGDSFDSGVARSAWQSPLAERGRIAALHRRRQLESSATPVPLPNATDESSHDQQSMEHGESLAAPLEPAASNASLREGRERAPRITARPSKAQVRAWLTTGDIGLALGGARAGAAADQNDIEWAFLLGDAARAAREFGEAVDVYLRAASMSSPSRATHAGFLAAYVQFHDLSDPRAALSTLTRWRVGVPGSPLEERGLDLTVRAQMATGDDDDARQNARAYLLRFPSGAARQWMQALIEPERRGQPGQAH